MRLDQKHIFLRTGILIMMLVYGFVFTSQTFLLSNLTTVAGSHQTSTITNRPANSIAVQRTDKTVITKNNIPNTLSNYSHLYVSLRVEKNIAALTRGDLHNSSQFLPDFHYSWLNNRALRI